jgi:aminoglycoside phosphotransferase (APT) family kinase protein
VGVRPRMAGGLGDPRAASPDGPVCFIHRDYHPGNTLWAADTLTAIVDWTTASLGAAGVDVGHMRWNLVVDYGAAVAERFLRHCRELWEIGESQAYWDVRTAVDLVGDVDPNDPLAANELSALEAHVARALRALG